MSFSHHCLSSGSLKSGTAGYREIVSTTFYRILNETGCHTLDHSASNGKQYLAGFYLSLSLSLSLYLTNKHGRFLEKNRDTLSETAKFMYIFVDKTTSVGVKLYNQTISDGVAHSKNPRKFAYHVTFDLDFDLDLEHTLDAGLPADHRVQVWWRSGHLPGRRSDFRANTKVLISRDL